MKIVKWIHESEIELRISSSDLGEVVNEVKYKLYKRSRLGNKTSDDSRYIRFESTSSFSPVSYEFTDNEDLAMLCCTLNDLGFVFWGTFKTERAPQDYMRHLQRVGVLSKSFMAISAGEDKVYTVNGALA